MITNNNKNNNSGGKKRDLEVRGLLVGSDPTADLSTRSNIVVPGLDEPSAPLPRFVHRRRSVGGAGWRPSLPGGVFNERAARAAVDAQRDGMIVTKRKVVPGVPYTGGDAAAE